MNFKERYTTADRKAADALLSEKDQTEQNKIVVSNDAYLNAEMTESLINKIEHLRLSLR